MDRSAGVSSTIAADKGAWPAESARVILVGKTGLDAALRGDERLELVRVRTPLEAVGELSSPIGPGSPSAAVVVLGEGPVDDSLGGEEDLLEALRRVDPRVRVVRLDGVGGEGEYDGSIPPGAPPERVRRVLLGGDDEPDRPAAPLPDVESLIHFMVAGEARVGDEALVLEMLRGGSVLGSALELIRQRVDGEVRFEAASDTAEPAAGAPVRWRGRLFGRLEGADPERLAAHASWLASWLALEKQHAELTREAFTDHLTGAWNRRYFDRFLSAAIEEARRYRRNLTVLVFDIDDFKQFNDRYGHAAGDAILVHATRLIKSVIRPTDKVCRIGGDEFAVIFYEPTGPRKASSRHPDSVFQIAKRFQEQIRQHRFPELGQGAPGTLTVSGGLATFPWDGRSAPELLAAADALALQSKRQGKNAITIGPGGERGD
jgi:diguanylate cyclase (GGDEF)-like protein